MGNKLSIDQKLFKAIKNNDLGDLKICLCKGANPNAINKDGLTPLQSAIVLSNYDIIEVLVNQPIDLNLTFGRIKMTVLHYAVHLNNIRLVQLLVDKGADIKIKDLNGDTPLDLAINYGYRDLIPYLNPL